MINDLPPSACNNLFFGWVVGDAFPYARVLA